MPKRYVKWMPGQKLPGDRRTKIPDRRKKQVKPENFNSAHAEKGVAIYARPEGFVVDQRIEQRRKNEPEKRKTDVRLLEKAELRKTLPDERKPGKVRRLTPDRRNQEINHDVVRFDSTLGKNFFKRKIMPSSGTGKPLIEESLDTRKQGSRRKNIRRQEDRESSR